MGGNPDIFKMTIERKGEKVTLSGSEADVDAFWGLIRSHLSSWTAPAQMRRALLQKHQKSLCQAHSPCTLLPAYAVQHRTNPHRSADPIRQGRRCLIQLA